MMLPSLNFNSQYMNASQQMPSLLGQILYLFNTLFQMQAFYGLGSTPSGQTAPLSQSMPGSENPFGSQIDALAQMGRNQVMAGSSYSPYSLGGYGVPSGSSSPGGYGAPSGASSPSGYGAPSGPASSGHHHKSQGASSSGHHHKSQGASSSGHHHKSQDASSSGHQSKSQGASSSGGKHNSQTSGESSSSGSKNSTPSSSESSTTSNNQSKGGGPSKIMDLSPFHLRLPTGSQGSPDSVKGSQLKNYNSPYFQMKDGKMTFFAPVTGVHTANSHNPRSELGQDKGWKMNSGNHSFSASLTLDQVPSSRDVTIGQIHQRGMPRPPVMLRWRDGKVVASVMETNDPSAKRKEYVLADNVPLGQRMNYQFNVSPNGSVGITFDGKTTNVNLDSSFNKGELYFKAGVYLNDNQGPSTEGARATFYGLQMT